MQTFQTILLILLVADAIALVVLVLLQQGKGADVGAAFGSGSANTLFGSAGSASFLTKATAWLAIGFFAISFGLAYAAKEQAAALREFPAVQGAPAGELPEAQGGEAQGEEAQGEELPGLEADEPPADEDAEDDFPDV